MNVKHGITGNKYILGTREEVENICDKIGKARSSIRYTEKYDCYVARIKSKKHKGELYKLAIKKIID